MTYYTIEFQTGTTGAAVVFAYSPTEFEHPKEEALSKFHEILMYAVKGSVPYHGAMVVSGDGVLEACQFYDHTGGGE